MHAVVEMLPSSGWAAALAGAAVRGAWESLVIAAFLAAVLRWAPGLSPRASFKLWGTGFALAALLPLCRAGAGRVFAGGGAAAHGFVPTVLLSPAWAAGLCALWMGATAAALVRFGAGVWSLRRLMRTASPAPRAVRAMYRELAAEGGRASRTNRAKLLVADGIAAPSACGLWGPAILLPRGLVESLSPDELAAVLRHEAAHLRRWDDWLTVLARLVRAALPLALALPYLERQMARAREMACDDAALRAGDSRPVSRRAYAACLARLAESAGRERWRNLAPGLGGEGSQLAARVGHILRGGAARGPGWVRLAAAGCAGALLSLALLGAPALLSFAGAHDASAEMARGPEPQPQLQLEPQLMPALAAAKLHAQPMRRIRPARWSVPVTHGRRPVLVAAAGREPRARLAQAGAPAVLVLWTGKQGFPEGNLILLVGRARDGAAAGWSNVFLLTI